MTEQELDKTTGKVAVRTPFPKMYGAIVTSAFNANLDHPRGRALYLCNRLANGNGYFDPKRQWWGIEPFTNSEHILDRLKRIRVETAERWWDHWQSGGSIKVIGKTHEEYLAQRRIDDKERRDRYKKMRNHGVNVT